VDPVVGRARAPGCVRRARSDCSLTRRPGAARGPHPEGPGGRGRLVMPGGESTTMSRLLTTSGLFDDLATARRRNARVRDVCRDDPAGHETCSTGETDQRGFGLIDSRSGATATAARSTASRPISMSSVSTSVPRGVHPGAAGRRAGPRRRGPRPPRRCPVLVRRGPCWRFVPSRADRRRPVHELFLQEVAERDMSGHSKWATIKHKKGAADKARGKLFAKLARQIEVAAREAAAIPTRTPRCAPWCRRPRRPR
jgi:hypothetical protein